MRNIWLFVLIILVFLGCIQSKAPEKEEIEIPEIISQEISDIEGEINETPEMDMGNQIGEGNLSEQENKSGETTGLLFGNGRYLLVLDDIVLDETKPDGACAAVKILRIIGEEAVELDKERVCKDADVSWVSPEGRVFRIRLIKIVPGYSQQSKWAEFRIFG